MKKTETPKSRNPERKARSSKLSESLAHFAPERRPRPEILTKRVAERSTAYGIVAARHAVAADILAPEFGAAGGDAGPGTNLVDGAGSVLANVHVFLIFWAKPGTIHPSRSQTRSPMQSSPSSMDLTCRDSSSTASQATAPRRHHTGYNFRPAAKLFRSECRQPGDQPYRVSRISEFQHRRPTPLLRGHAQWHQPGRQIFLSANTSASRSKATQDPLAAGGIAHYDRDNDDPKLPWYGPSIFAQDVGNIDAMTLIQSHFGSPGNLEVVARFGDELLFYFRDSGPAFHWFGPFQLTATRSGFS